MGTGPKVIDLPHCLVPVEMLQIGLNGLVEKIVRHIVTGIPLVDPEGVMGSVAGNVRFFINQRHDGPANTHAIDHVRTADDIDREIVSVEQVTLRFSQRPSAMCIDHCLDAVIGMERHRWAGGVGDLEGYCQG